MAIRAKKNKKLLDLVKSSSSFNFSIIILFDNTEYLLLEEDLMELTYHFIQQQLNLNKNGNIN